MISNHDEKHVVPTAVNGTRVGKIFEEVGRSDIAKGVVS
jgi:hypothetical protein